MFLLTVVRKRDARRVLKELMKRHTTHVLKVSTYQLDRSMKSIMHVKIQITSVIEIILVIYYVKITSLIDSDYCPLS